MVVATIGYFRGPNSAVAVGFIVSFAFPRWIASDYLYEDFDIRVAVGLLMLGYYCVHPKSVFRTNLCYVDFLFLALVCCGLASDFWNDGFQFWTVALAYCEWVVPYLLGRLAFHRQTDIKLLVAAVTGVSLIIGTCAIVESSTTVNLFELLFGERPSDLPKYLERFGWQRAFGPTENPIFLGSLLVILIPWTFSFTVAAIREHQRWPLILPVVHFLGICSTISRGPIFGFFVFFAVVSLLSWNRLRAPLLIILSIAVAGIPFQWNELRRDIRELGGDETNIPAATITVDSQKVEYSNTDHRLLLWSFYKKAILNAGCLGYGSERTSTFPPNVPMDGKSDLQAFEKLWCIDNQYLLFILRFGFCGVALWIGVLVAAAVAFAHLGCMSIEQAFLFKLLCGAIVAAAFVQFTVWMPMDYGIALIWTIGLSAGGLTSYRR